MGQLIYVVFNFLSLDFFNVGDHFSASKIFGEFLTDKGIHVESSQGDELQFVINKKFS
jgi:hypothetical protein